MHPDGQTLIAAALVAACSGYWAWSLMPAEWRRRLAAWSGRPLPQTPVAGGCGSCGACGRGRSPQGTPGPAVIHVVRRPSR